MTTEGQKLAFIGLGRIGYPIALNLTHSQDQLLAYDPGLGSEQRSELESRGWGIASSIEELAQWAPDAVFTVLPNSDIVDATYDNDFVGLLKPGTLCVDLSTGYPEASAALGSRLAAHGLKLVEAPICAGAVPGAYAGQLTLSVSGEDEAIAAVRPYLERVASTLLIMPTGVQAQSLKLMTNYVVMGTHAMISELLALGSTFGLNQTEVVSYLEQCAAGRLLNFPALSQTLFGSEDVPLFRTELATKDLKYATRIAAENETLFLIGHALHQYFLLSQHAGGRDAEALPSLWQLFQGWQRRESPEPGGQG